jgi:2'-5' RNA ligase
MAFIGEYSDPDAVLDAMEASRPESAVLALEGVGSFGKLWWIGLKKDESLFANSRRLRRALSDAGIPFDRKRFSPHITLVYDILINCTFYKSYDIIQTRQSEGPLYEIHA